MRVNVAIAVLALLAVSTLARPDPEVYDPTKPSRDNASTCAKLVADYWYYSSQYSVAPAGNMQEYYMEKIAGLVTLINSNHCDITKKSSLGNSQSVPEKCDELELEFDKAYEGTFALHPAYEQRCLNRIKVVLQKMADLECKFEIPDDIPESIRPTKLDLITSLECASLIDTYSNVKTLLDYTSGDIQVKLLSALNDTFGKIRNLKCKFDPDTLSKSTKLGKGDATFEEGESCESLRSLINELLKSHKRRIFMRRIENIMEQLKDLGCNEQ